MEVINYEKTYTIRFAFFIGGEFYRLYYIKR